MKRPTRTEFIAQMLALDLDASKYVAMTDAEYDGLRDFQDEKTRKIEADKPRRRQ